MIPFPTVLIGFGRIADTMRHDRRMARYFADASHAQLLTRHEAFEWVGVVDPVPAARARAQAEWGVRQCAADLMELPGRERIEAAVIASPPGGRLAILEALPSLRVLLAEKPLGRTAEEARSFIAACARRNILVQVNYWRRAVPAFQTLAAGGMEEAVGAVQAVSGLYGNGMMNNGSHLVDFLRMLCGEVESIEGCGVARGAPASSVTGDRDVSCLLRLSNGASAALSPVDFSAWREVGLDIWGTNGRLSILQEGLTMTHYPVAENRGLEKEMEIDSGSADMSEVDVRMALSSMYDSLAAAALGAGGPCCNGDEALRSELVVHDILAKAST